jgi:uncharacterized membrane protein YfcA
MLQWAQNPAVLIAFGIFIGIFSGLMGLGGGSVMIPIMVLLFGLSQTQAHGMSLAIMIPPVTLPAVIRYWQEGTITRNEIGMILLIALGFACGSYFGAWIANAIGKANQSNLKLVFGMLLTYVAAYTVFSAANKDQIGRNALMAISVVAFCALMYGLMRVRGQTA